MTETIKEFKLPAATDDELRQFVDDVLSGHVFTSAQVTEPDLLPMVFMPLAFGCYADVPEEQLKEIGVLYAPMAKAGPRSINGYPIFFEVRALSRRDWQRALAAIRAEQERRKNILIPEGVP